MLQKLGWHWEACGSKIALSGEGLVTTKAEDDGRHLVTGGSLMTEGRHYWEVELAWANQYGMTVGAVRPGLDHDRYHLNSNNAYEITTSAGGLFGNGKSMADEQGEFLEGDRIGMLLDLDAGWMRFYRNGKRCGPGFTEGVTGPLVRAAELSYKGEAVAVVPGAVAPEGAGAADEPWDEPEPESESEPEAGYTAVY
jgi:hypothetical protein